jgi:hypothetical protein
MQMALRDSRLFRAFGYTIVALALASFVLDVAFQVASGNGANVYQGGRGLPISYAAALVTIVALALVGAIWLCQIVWRRWRHLFVRGRDA